MFGGFPRNEEFMQPFFVAFRGKRVIVVLRPDDERFRFCLECGLPATGIAPPDEFDSSISTELKLSEFARRVARKAKNFLNVPIIHSAPPLEACSRECE